MIQDPVCGVAIDQSEAAGQSRYRGRTYHFCSDRCMEAFDSNPAEYDFGEDTPARAISLDLHQR